MDGASIKADAHIVEAQARGHFVSVGVIYAKVQHIVLLSRFDLSTFVSIANIHADQMIDKQFGSIMREVVVYVKRLGNTAIFIAVAIKPPCKWYSYQRFVKGC